MKKFYLLLIFLSLLSYSNNAYTLEDLEKLKQDKIITLEDYEILKADLMGIRDEIFDFYSLKINQSLVSTDFKVVDNNGIKYLDVLDFVNLLGIKNFNYNKENKYMEIFLGENLRKIVLDYSKGYISIDGKNFKDQDIFLNVSDTFLLREDMFKEAFLNSINIQSRDLKVDMFLSFTAPKDITKILDATKAKIDREKEKKVLIFKSENQLFDLGYLRTRVNLSFNKAGFDWNSDIAYQGSLLYGQFYTNYDIKNKRLGDLVLHYPNVYNNHSLKLENRSGNDSRHFALSFSKERSYYNTGEKIIIKEKVPLGSRAELLYMNTPIDIQDEKDGFVVFDNENIKNDKTYELKIYTPDKKIELKTINPLEDYNKQRAKDITYNINLVHNPNYNHAITGNANIYYGISDKLTIGAGLSKDLELYRSPVDRTEDFKSRFVYTANANMVYSGVYNGISYGLRLGANKVLNNEIDERRRNLLDKQSLNYGIDLRYKNYSLNYQEEFFGKYYDKEKERKLDLKTDLFKKLKIGYSYTGTKERRKPFSHRHFLSLDTDFKIQNVLLSAGAKLDLNEFDKSTYRIGAYYAGFQNTTLKFENTWTNNFKEHEAKFSIYNNNYKGLFDFLFEASYSNTRKALFTFRVSLRLDDLLNIDSTYQTNGNYGVNLGIDKIIDLKNPAFKLKNLDVSRANVIAFVDANDNDKFDEGEKTLEDVELTIGNQTKITKEDGKAIFYGLTNGLEHKIDVKIKKPNFILTAKEIKILSTASSSINAYIPIKPMIDLSGYVDFDKTLNLNQKDKEDFYSNVLIEIKDLSGKTLELVAPDNTGHFDVSGLFPKEYLIEVSYLGTKYNIPNLKKNLLLSYRHSENSQNDFNYNISLEFSNDEVKLISKK